MSDPVPKQGAEGEVVAAAPDATPAHPPVDESTLVDDATLVDDDPPAASAAKMAPDASGITRTAVAPDIAAPNTATKQRRYRVQMHDNAPMIISGNAPNIRLRIERGLTVDARGRKRFGPQTIFLDGVYSGAPFCDNEARHYSLDHHANCVRGFTLATCEQAAVMLLQGLPLSSDRWTIYVNDPDLDSLLSAWILINHVELLRDDKALLRAAMPVIRLEGVIDAHGTEREILTGFPEAYHKEIRAKVDGLMKNERELKAGGAWHTTNWVEYAVSMFEEMDALLFPEEVLNELMGMQESGRASLEGGRIAVMLESPLGIYEVEAQLKQRYGNALGVIVLQIDTNRYTLRLVDAFLRKDLVAVYRALNRVDPRARSGGTNPNVWGGSSDIGGSPRGTGTGLSGQQILDVVQSVLGVQPPWYQKLWTFVRGLIKPTPPALPPR